MSKIIVGGHEITTNKVGSVHTVTSLENSWSGTVRWCVTNGICVVSLAGVGRSGGASSPLKVCTVPKAKFACYMDCSYSSQTGRAYLEAGTTDLLLYSANSNSMYFTLVYPVADDWNE